MHKSHNVSVLIYHLVCPAKYRRIIFDESVDEELKRICAEIASTIKSITAREIFRRLPPVKKNLWGGESSTDGYFINTVGQKGNETSVSEYVRNQGREKECKQLFRDRQLSLFDTM